METAAAFRPIFRGIGDGVMAQLRDLTDEELNASLALPETNTLFQLATHVAGSIEFWVLQMAGGVDVHRDRLAEFQARGTARDLAARFGGWMPRVDDALRRLEGHDLTRAIPTPAEYLQFRAPGDARTAMTILDCLLGALEHAALHQGQIQLTRQLVRARTGP